MNASDPSWATKIDSDRFKVAVNLNIYPIDVIFRTCYLFTDRCFLFLSEESESVINVFFAQMEEQHNLTRTVGEFCNELINQKLVATIAKETQTVRNLIVAQAFAEADFLESENTKDSKE